MTALLGTPTPRVATVRPSGRSRGLEAITFARDELGVKPLDWQEHVLRAGLIWNRNRWASRTVGVLVGRQNGKTSLATIRALAGMCIFGERRILASAQNRDVALDAWREALELAIEADLKVGPVLRTTGREEFWIGDARYKVVSSTRQGARGQVADLVICDEVREYRDWGAWAALEKTRRARASSQLWALSSEGDEGSVVLAQMAAAGRAAAQAKTPTDAAWLEWSAAPGISRHDPRAWAASNPGMGVLVSPDTIASEAIHDQPEVFETEVLCRRVTTLHPWLGEGLWDGCLDAHAVVPDGVPVAFGLHAADDLSHASIGVAWKRGDGRIHVETVDAWHADSGPVLVQAALRLGELITRWPTLTVAAVDRSPAEAAVRRVLTDTGIPVASYGATDLERAGNGLLEAVIARQLVHPDDPLTAVHLASIDGRHRFPHPRLPTTHIDAGIAVTIAHLAATRAKDLVPEPDWVAY